MLRYIELLSEHRTPSSAKWKAATTKRQREYNELKFSAVSIDEKRSAMSIEIRRLGEEQRLLHEAIRASREQNLEKLIDWLESLPEDAQDLPKPGDGARKSSGS